MGKQNIYFTYVVVITSYYLDRVQKGKKAHKVKNFTGSVFDNQQSGQA